MKIKLEIDTDQTRELLEAFALIQAVLDQKFKKKEAISPDIERRLKEMELK